MNWKKNSVPLTLRLLQKQSHSWIEFNRHSRQLFRPTPSGQRKERLMPRDYAKLMGDRYEEKVADMVVSLRSLADRIERDAAPTPNHVSVPRFAWAAHNVIHEVTWAMANLNLDSLVVLAAEADEAYAFQDPV